MADDYSELFTVHLERHVDKVRRMTPVGPADDEITYDQHKVWVKGPAVRTDAKCIHVGYIGTHAGANFCPLPGFYKFVLSQRQWIAAEAKRLHGNASPDPYGDVPPPL